MTEMSHLKEAEAFLDRERDIILSGDLAELERLGSAREEFEAILSRAEADMAALGRLRQKATRNAALLKAAGEGVRSAMTRISALRKAAGPLDSYTPTGRPEIIGEAAHAVERKA